MMMMMMVMMTMLTTTNNNYTTEGNSMFIPEGGLKKISENEKAGYV